jgi:sn-glycerol 3-phosphate transport system substrate-binding protein
VTFYYPIAVGGPITKIVDQMAADFEKENPGIKVKPVYAGSYQDTIVKALTAHKSGTPPTTAILLSTDMFTLIDEDAIVPFETADAAALLPGLPRQQPDGRQDVGLPFQRSTIVLYWNKELFKEAGSIPNKPPARGRRCASTRRSSPARRRPAT